MKRILLVEDQPNTLRYVKKLLGLKFPGVVVDDAPTEHVARELLATYARDGKQLDAAVLDIMVPKSQGTTPVVSTLCEDVRKLSANAIVGHITAYSDDHHVTEHVVRRDLSNHGAADFFVDKTADPDWSMSLIKTLATLKIERDLDSITQSHIAVSRTVGRAGRHQGATYRRADLVRDIANYWKLLDPQLQARIRKQFGLGEDDEPVAL